MEAVDLAIVKVLTAEVEAMVRACMKDGKPTAPQMQDLMRARGMLPASSPLTLIKAKESRKC